MPYPSPSSTSTARWPTVSVVLRNVNDVADRFGFRRIADGDVE
jgi:hypothetical protein